MTDVDFKVDAACSMRKGLGMGLWIYDCGKLVAVYYKPLLLAIKENESDFMVKEIHEERFVDSCIGIKINVYNTKVIVVTNAVDKFKFSAPLLVNQNVLSYGLLDTSNVYYKIQALVNDQQAVIIEPNVEYRCATLNETKCIMLLCEFNKNITCTNVRYATFLKILYNYHSNLKNN
jgi:hypothetical protein